jgi:hypothetical protein
MTSPLKNATETINISSPMTQKAAVLKTIKQFLKSLGNLDYKSASCYLSPTFGVTVARIPHSEHSTLQMLGKDWFQYLKATPRKPFQEILSSVTVNIEDNAVAHVRSHFKIVQSKKAQSCGIDHFILIKHRQTWKISALAYTSRLTRPPQES